MCAVIYSEAFVKTFFDGVTEIDWKPFDTHDILIICI